MDETATSANVAIGDALKYFMVDSFETVFDITFTSPAGTNPDTTTTRHQDDSLISEKSLPHIIPYMQSAFTRLSRILMNSTIHFDNNNPPTNDNAIDHTNTRGGSSGSGGAERGGVWLGPHSALLMAPHGSGKTHLVTALLAHLSSQHTHTRPAHPRGWEEDENGKVPLNHFNFLLVGECAASFPLTEETSEPPLVPDVSASPEVGVNSPRQVFLWLQRLVTALPATQTGTDDDIGDAHIYQRQLRTISDHVSETGQLPSICIVIDNADSLIAANEDTSSSSVNSDSKLASFYLQQLLGTLSTPVCSHSICLLATTSLTNAVEVAPAFLGPPGFEVTVTLPLPNYNDRCLLLKSFFDSSCGGREHLSSALGELPLSFASPTQQSHDDICVEGEDDLNVTNEVTNVNYYDDDDDDDEHNVLVWSESHCASHLVFDWMSRAASLTAGYLPADLQNITRRAMGLASGRGLDKSSESDSDEQRERNPPTSQHLQWKDFLIALTATTPNQLQSVAMSEGGGGGGIVVESRDSSLSWDNFAGYSEQKESISHILERSNPLYGMKRKKTGSLHTREQTRGTDQKKEGRSVLSQAVGQQSPKGLVLYGPSGCGKSHMARIIAAEVRGEEIYCHRSDSFVVCLTAYCCRDYCYRRHCIIIVIFSAR